MISIYQWHLPSNSANDWRRQFHCLVYYVRLEIMFARIIVAEHLAFPKIGNDV